MKRAETWVLTPTSNEARKPSLHRWKSCQEDETGFRNVPRGEVKPPLCFTYVSLALIILDDQCGLHAALRDGSDGTHCYRWRRRRRLIALDVVSGDLASAGSLNFAVGDDSGITQSGIAEAMDAEDEDESFPLIPFVKGEQRNIDASLPSVYPARRHVRVISNPDEDADAATEDAFRPPIYGRGTHAGRMQDVAVITYVYYSEVWYRSIVERQAGDIVILGVTVVVSLHSLLNILYHEDLFGDPSFRQESLQPG
ncbi:hypothetical protein C8R45DRAFT_933899 [Mycena sanguinolenta]|nr:hypothetical protein C8R45DRAFT_933899 [Mycena sanguinolenta]